MLPPQNINALLWLIKYVQVLSLGLVVSKGVGLVLILEGTQHMNHMYQPLH